MTEPTDLGFGRVVAQAVRGRFLNRDGTATGRKYGLGAQRSERFYLGALNARWPSFLLWTTGCVLLLNGIFALAYLALGPSALSGVAHVGLDDPFLRAFSFSVGLFTTNGTGTLIPVGTTAHWLVIFESLFGPLILVAASGVIIARLSRPRMRIQFSESAIIAPYEGGRGLMFRMVNALPGEISDVAVRLNLSRFETVNGVRERNFHPLQLERHSVELFNLHWTVVHPITSESPLAGVTPETLAASGAEFMVFVTAHEETFSTRVTTRTSYTYEEVRWDVKFASIFASASDDVLAIDVDRLDRTERLAENATAVPAAIETTH
jgi:inward rectifier potassium channel